MNTKSYDSIIMYVAALAQKEADFILGRKLESEARA